MTQQINISTSNETNYRIIFPFLPFMSTGTIKEKGDSLLLYCKNALLPGISMATTDIENQFIKMRYPSKELTFGEFTITYAIDELFENYRLIYNWIMALKNPEEFKIDNIKKCDLAFHILSNNKNPKVKFVFKDAFPINISDIAFTYGAEGSNDVDCTATFAYNYFLMED